MSAPQFRAWRFLHPDIEATAEFAGLQTAPTGRIEMVEGPASVRQAIFLLLTTTPGERVMRPDYGCNLHRLIFSPNDDTTAGLAIHFVRKALQRWEPRIRVLRLDAGRNENDSSRLDIVLEYVIRATQRREEIGLTVDLSGGKT